MASNGFFEFLGDLKGLYDEASRRRDWAKQYNPYNGGNAWFRGLGAINQMMDRNAEDRALKAQRQEYKAGTDDAPRPSVGVDENGFVGFGQPTASVSVGSYSDGTNNLGVMPQQSSGGNGFSSIFGSNDFNGGSLVNPPIPSTSSSSDSLAQRVEGQNNVSARDLSRYLSNDYNMANWMQADAERGVDNPYISALRYGAKIAPLVQAAREDDMRNAFMTYNNRNATPEQRADAIAKLSYYTKQPDLAERIQRAYDNDMYRQGYLRDRSDVGNNILSTFKDYEEGEQWMSPDGTGDSRTQCSNFVSDVLRKVGLDIGSPNGDELMKQFGKAYHTGLDGIQAGDVLNFKNHVGFYVGNGQYIARNSSGGVHQGSMEEAVQAFGQPLGYASVREYASGRPRYKENTTQEKLLRQRHEYRMEEIEKQNELREKLAKQRTGSALGDMGGIKVDRNGKVTLDYENDNRVGTATDVFKAEFDNPTGKDGKMSANAMLGIVNSLSPIYKYLTNNGISENNAKLMMRDILNDKLGKEYQGKVGYKMMGDIVDRISLGGGQQPTQQQVNNVGGYGAKVNEKKKDGTNHVGFKDIFGMGNEADEYREVGQNTSKERMNQIQANTNRVAREKALANGVIAGFTNWGTPVDKYGNEVEIDQFGEAKDGLTPEERRQKFVEEREGRFGTIANQY